MTYFPTAAYGRAYANRRRGRTPTRTNPTMQAVAEAFANGDRPDGLGGVRSATASEVAKALGMEPSHVRTTWARIRSKQGWQAV